MTSFSTRLYTRPLPFPSYLFPSNPFRSRSNNTNNTTTTTTTTTTASSSTTTTTTPHYLNGHTSYLRCARCSTDLCLTSQIISKGFTGRHGRAYLVCPTSNNTSSQQPSSSSSSSSSLPNTITHKAMPRQLVTGAHTVSDISCSMCGAILGWKYVAAEDEAQRYKVGKFILETRKIRVGWCWEEDEDGAKAGEGGGGMKDMDVKKKKEKEKKDHAGVVNLNVEFDSQDEEECDDLFAGVWSPGLALKRRKGKRFVRGE